MGSLYALPIVLIIFFGEGLIDDAEDSLIEQSDLNMASPPSFAMEHKRGKLWKHCSHDNKNNNIR